MKYFVYISTSCACLKDIPIDIETVHVNELGRPIMSALVYFSFSRFSCYCDSAQLPLLPFPLVTLQVFFRLVDASIDEPP